MIVDQAAPCIPSSGKGPNPKISKGSKTALMKPADAIKILGVFVSPMARRILFPVMMQTINTEPGNQMFMYSRMGTIN